MRASRREQRELAILVAEGGHLLARDSHDAPLSARDAFESVRRGALQCPDDEVQRIVDIFLRPFERGAGAEARCLVQGFPDVRLPDHEVGEQHRRERPAGHAVPGESGRDEDVRVERVATDVG